jgi:hypothetical protein
MDATITSPVDTEEGTVVLHPHSDIAYVFLNGEWEIITHDTITDVKEISDSAYDRAMQGV